MLLNRRFDVKVRSNIEKIIYSGKFYVAIHTFLDVDYTILGIEKRILYLCPAKLFHVHNTRCKS